MAEAYILLILSEPSTGEMLERAALRPAGYEVNLVTDRQTAELLIQGKLPSVIIMSDGVPGDDNLEFAAHLLERYPQLPIILLPESHSEALVVQAMQMGFADYLQPPVRINAVQQSVHKAIERRANWEKWARLEAKRNTKTLQQRVTGLEAIQKIGRKVTALLDLDGVLAAVVDAAVELTGAEEGSLLLMDEMTGELYMRAGRNFQEEFVRTFRLPIRDTLAGQVLRTGKPLLIDEQTPKKIKTSYLVYSIIYVPLVVHERVIGVLEVDNRQSKDPFNEYHVSLVSALADYAAIAVENARLYSRTEVERNQLETILTNIEEGVIIIDTDGRLMLVNRVARAAFDLTDKNPIGKPVRDTLHHPELLELLSEEKRGSPAHTEISLEDGRVLNAQLTPIPEVGLAITMQDITHLKELDRIKSDFVNTVSHDLRSPLTAILGYIELLDRVGTLNDQQTEFVRRVQVSVHTITALINDLLDLGRIEAGFDARKEFVPITAILRYTLESLRNRVMDKNQDLVVEIPEILPDVLGNPVRLRQMFSNLLGNAIKYTPNNGQVRINVVVEGEQIIFQICDNGPGIPPSDQPYIFDKFYRASNVPHDTPGTGLGLAIVKSIVDNHQGRIWVDSTMGQGTIFTVVLPVADQEL